MKKRLLSALILFILFAAFALPASAGEGVKYVLGNGMTVVLKENHSSPIVAVQVWVKAGSATEPAELAGISHVLEHMAFKGTKKRGVGEIAREVEALGGDINAYTTFDHTVYHITISSRYLAEALDILSDTLANSTFDEKELKKEVEVVLEEYRMNQDDPSRVASKELFSAFFKKHPYGRPVIGYPETLKKITRESLLKYFRSYYVPNNMVLVVAGDISVEKAKPLVEKFMGRLKKKKFVLPERPPEPSRNRVEVTVKKMESGRAYVNLAFPGVALGSEDVFAVDLLSMILGDGETSRLYRTVKEEKGLVDGIYAYSFTPKDPGVIMVGFTCDPENVKPAIESTLEEIYRIAVSGVSPSELSRAKKNTIASFVYSLESQSSLARLLGFYETALGDAFFQERYVDMVRRVTVEDIKKAAQKYLRENNFVVAGVLPKDSTVTLTEGEVEKMAEKAQAVVVGEKRTSRRAIVRKVLKNGVRLIVRENHAVPVVAVSIGFLGGVRAETPEVSGVCNLMSFMLTRGTKKHTAYEIAEMVEDMAASIDSFSGRNSFGIKGEFLSEDFDRGMRLLAEMILSPTFDEEELEKRKKDVISAIRAQEDSPFQELLKLYLKAQYGEHPYSMDPLGTEETVEAITRDDLIEYYSRLVFPKNMVIVVSGDVSPQHAEEVVQELFEDFASEGDESIFAEKKVPPLPKAVKVEKKREKLQAHFLIGFLGARFSDDDRYPLEVLSAALAGQGGRLFRNLRDEKSLAYSLTAFSSEQFDRGFLAFYMATAASKKDEAISAMWDEIIKFLKEGLTKEELERAKNFVIGNFEIGLQSNQAYADSIMFNELYGTGIEGFEKFTERIRKVTRKDVMRVARKYIDLERYVLAVVSP